MPKITNNRAVLHDSYEILMGQERTDATKHHELFSKSMQTNVSVLYNVGVKTRSSVAATVPRTAGRLKGERMVLPRRQWRRAQGQCLFASSGAGAL